MEPESFTDSYTDPWYDRMAPVSFGKEIITPFTFEFVLGTVPANTEIKYIGFLG